MRTVRVSYPDDPIQITIVRELRPQCEAPAYGFMLGPLTYTKLFPETMAIWNSINFHKHDGVPVL